MSDSEEGYGDVIYDSLWNAIKPLQTDDIAYRMIRHIRHIPMTDMKIFSSFHEKKLHCNTM